VTAEQERLITDHYHVAEACYWNMRKRVPYHVDTDALWCAAMEGLVRAALAFDGSTGWKFSSWAWLRMVGAMQDEMRRMDPHSRSERKAIKSGDESVAEITFCELNEAVYGRGTRTEDHAPRVCSRLDFVRCAASLPQRTRYVLMYRLAGFSMGEIARAYGITESRVSQILKDARRKVAVGMAA
jgi:RNA polymerase sigma factor (sigma-70 family)